MPIEGLTDQIRIAFPVIGKLKKGEPQEAGKPLRDTDHFRFLEREGVKGVAAAFEAAYGADPQLVHVFLPYPTVDDNFECWKEEWGAGGLKHRCNGRDCTVWQDSAGNYQRTPKPCPGKCKEVGRLSVWIPELLAADFTGTVTVETHSKHDIRNILGSLRRVADMRRGDRDGLVGIEWVLIRRPTTVSVPMGNGKRGKATKWLLFLEPSVEWLRNRLAEAQRVAMLTVSETETETDNSGSPASVEQGQEDAEFDEAEEPVMVTEDGEVVDAEPEREPPVEAKPVPEPHPPSLLDRFYAECRKLGVNTPAAIAGALGAPSVLEMERGLDNETQMVKALKRLAKLKGKPWPTEGMLV